ncbi:MAG: hypothetical protein IBX55_05590 [Methyloprofundus sp.]|nr:hypothetical protein [Methyloprofundus sp.]
MPLQQLVEYFNDRLEWEHHTRLRPFLLKEGLVQGLFGPIRTGTHLEAVRETQNSARILGYAASLQVATNEIPHLQNHELELILSLPSQPAINPDSIINFDRLARTVHMLNFLPHAHEPVFLQLEVDPRHVLGVKKDHGAYFQEVITKCGLETGNIVIALRLSSDYAQYYQALIAGLENYRKRGYRLTLQFDYPVLSSGSAQALISALSPDWVEVSAKGFSATKDSVLLQKLQQTQRLAASAGAQSLLSDINHQELDSLAYASGFEAVAGSYYQANVSAWTDDVARLAQA